MMATKKKKTAEEKVISYLGRRETPTTVETIAARTDLPENTVRNALLRLRDKSRAWVDGREAPNGIGRPQNLWYGF